MIDIIEFTSILVLMYEWDLTSKNTERLFEQHICAFTGKVNLVIFFYSNLSGLMCERGL